MSGRRSDEELFVRYRERADAAAFAEVYDRYASAVFGFLQRFVRDRAAAEDLVQQTFLRMHESRDAFDAHLNLRTWIFTIARRLAINWLERARRLVGPPSEHTVDPAPTPEQHAVVRAEVRRVEDALAQLAPDDASVVILARFEGMTSEELANVLDCSPDAAKMRLHRALRRLGELLGESLSVRSAVKR